jgi:hypothetical protein
MKIKDKEKKEEIKIKILEINNEEEDFKLKKNIFIENKLMNNFDLLLFESIEKRIKFSKFSKK